MGKKNLHAGIRISKQQKLFLGSIHTGIQRTFNIGYQALIMSVHTDPAFSCIYISKKAECDTQSEAQQIKGLDPIAHCCPSCPVRKAMPKRIPAALQPGQNGNADMIEREPEPACPDQLQ